MVRLKSDLVDLVEHGVNGTLDRVEAEWDRRAALGVVLAARGYPERAAPGDVIEGLDRVTPKRIRTARCSMPGTAPDEGKGRRHRRARAVRDRARRFREAGATRGVRGARRDPVRRHAVPRATSAIEPSPRASA